GHVERFGLAPERVERKLAEIGVLDVGGDNDTAGSEPAGAFELGCRALGLNERNGGDPGEPIRVVRAPHRQRVVEHPMPGDAGVGGKAVPEWAGPGADDLLIDALLVEPGAPRRAGFDRAKKDGAPLEAVVKMHRRWRGAGWHQAHADLLAAGDDGVDQLRRN